MVSYSVCSMVNGENVSVCETYKTKANAIKRAHKRFDSGCYKRVIVWRDTEEYPEPKKCAMILELKQD